MKDYPPGTCAARSRSIKSCRGLAQCSYYRQMSAADHATVRSVHSVHTTPHVSTHTVQWHVVISDTGAPAAAEAGITMAGCRSPVICYLLSATALYSIYNLHNSINTTSHDTSLGGQVCAEPLSYIIRNCMVLSCAAWSVELSTNLT